VSITISALTVALTIAFLVTLLVVLGLRFYFRSSRIAPERALRTVSLASLYALFGAMATGLLGIMLTDPDTIVFYVLQVFTGLDMYFVDGPALIAIILVTFLLIALMIYTCHEVAVRSRSFRRFLRGKSPRP
jgi:uncharacterized membrane protein YfcA